MSSTVIWLCASALIPASADGAGPTTALPSKPDTPLVCLDDNFLAKLRKERTMRERWRQEVRRLRVLCERCCMDPRIVVESERCLQEVDRRVAAMEDLLRSWGVDPGRIPKR